RLFTKALRASFYEVSIPAGTIQSSSIDLPTVSESLVSIPAGTIQSQHNNSKKRPYRPIWGVLF
ncbi:MAG: hypothetical protein AAFR59_05435, partial [Bacteroidota bacterium]